MTAFQRPLGNKSIDELTAIAERNWQNAAELLLVRSELNYRNTNAATKLRSTVDTWLADLAKPTYVSPALKSARVQPDPVSQQAREWTNAAVAKLRAKLIDLSRKSPLISFKHTSRSASQLRIVDERPDLLWKRLNEGTMGFEPLPGEDQTPPDEVTPEFRIAYERARLIDLEFQKATENLGDSESEVRTLQEAERLLRSRVREELGLPKISYGKTLDVAAIARAHGFDPSYELKFSDDEGLQDHHEDNSIRVLLTRKELEKRLKTIWDRAGTHMRETGLHTLHLAMGFVQWFEDDTSDVAMHAPLLLLPVTLDREVKRGRFEYTLRATGDELEVNIALVEKARAHWGLHLPDLRDEESPESYFIRTKAVLAQGHRLQFNCFATLAVLPPMILWKDLDPQAWPQDAFANHRLLPGLLGAAEFRQTSSGDSDIDIDDPVNAEKVPALITDADASQHKAIMDMAAGHDMAIEGPPGTGKSQTITNMIATALAQGKRVLFVAEKQAALRVVADRLRVAGFGPLLLELHGDRAIRSDVYASINERLDYQSRHDPKFLEINRRDIRRHRDLLRRYLSLIRSPLGALEATAHDLAWREIRLRSRFTREEIAALEARWSPDDPRSIDRSTLTEHREVLEQYGEALSKVGAKGSVWTKARRLNPFDQSPALKAAASAGAAARSIADAAERLAALGVAFPAPNEDYHTANKQLSAVKPVSCTNESIVAAALHAPEVAEDLLVLQAKWTKLKHALSSEVEQPEALDDAALAELATALSMEDCPDVAADIVPALRAAEELTRQLAAAGRDLDRLIERLAAGAETPVRSAEEVCACIAKLAELPPSSSTMLRQELADPQAAPIIAGAEKEALDLRAERAALREIVRQEAFTAEPEVLDATADILEGTGFFGRFSGRYRTAYRQAVRYLGEVSNREEAAASLRRVSTLLRTTASFETKNKAKHLFPPLLWDGIDSDFTSLRLACTTIAEAANKLAVLDEIGLLGWWLHCEITDRPRLAASCARVSGVLGQLVSSGFGEVSLGEAADLAVADKDALARLDQAARATRLRPECRLWDGSATIAERIGHFNAIRLEFDERRSGSGGLFAWVGGIEEDLTSLQTSSEELDSVEAAEGPLDVLELLAASATPAALCSELVGASQVLAAALSGWSACARECNEVVGIAPEELIGSTSWDALSIELLSASTDREGASLAADLLKYRASLFERSISALGTAADENIVEPAKLADAYELLLLSALLRSFLGSDGNELSRLGSLSLEAARKAFRQIDKDLHKLEAASIVGKRLSDSVPQGKSYGRKSEYTDLGLILSEVALKRPRTPLRDVVHRAGAALQALKPVWMMSPTSVAQFIKPGTHSFDLLIVDEASQMRPEFSLSCILRGKQFVVVGDANQLPPSDHFQMGGTVDEDDDANSVGVDEGTESILDLANQRFRKKRRLKWHYRSQHESLIQFSNRQFYDRELVVFPSPSGNDDDLMGVKCIYVPAIHSDTEYEASINQREAEVTIEQAFGLMQRYPERSIGIVAMNAKQTELIKNEFDRLIVEEDQVRRYVEAFAGTVDEFFIKNLENVQGDERDIILISTVYGPDKSGKVRQNFGLINREVGWRRLNVLVTRAKLSCRLITSLRPDDIKVVDTSSRGLIAFKAYLTYVHNGAQYEDASGGETDSDFEIFVADAIRDAGYEVVYQVGVEKFRIDLGVRHPSCPIGFIGGIECDGAPYHSGLSVRDRDHIRQSVLEGLGWRIYRVWSTDWFADPARETAKLINWLDGIRDKLVSQLGPLNPPQTLTASVGELLSSAPPGQDLAADDVVSKNDNFSLDNSGNEDVVDTRQPVGRKLRMVDDIQPYEAVPGLKYELWKLDDFLGEVEVIKRATASPRLYGGQVQIPKSEYEGRVASTGDRFISYDLYAAIREVARRSVDKDNEG